MNLPITVSSGILIPLLGTAAGAAAVFFFNRALNQTVQKVFFGFAAGVMLASSVWSLLLPSLESGGALQGGGGLLSGFLIFLAGDALLSRAQKRKAGKNTGGMLALAVTLHKIPEGMAVGVAFAGALASPGAVLAPAMILSAGIALQNVPEGAVISMPLAGLGMRKGRAFFWGALSGAVEPLGAAAALALTRFVVPALPFFLSFAAGAMIYVAAVELIPELPGGEGERAGYAALIGGFAVMMLLDVLLG